MNFIEEMLEFCEDAHINNIHLGKAAEINVI